MNIKPKKSNHAVPKNVGQYEYGDKIRVKKLQCRLNKRLKNIDI